MIKITFPDLSVKEFECGITAEKIAETIDGETNTYYILIADLSLSDTRKQVEDFLYGKDRSILIDVDDAENAKNWKLGYLYRTPDGKIYTLNN